jgi:hypothetical protein
VDRSFAADYILANFKASDRLAVVVTNRQTAGATQRIGSAERIASDEFQAWLRHRNAQGDDIYLSMNALKPEADRRTKQNVGDVRHIYLDFDQDGAAAVRRLTDDAPLARPSHIVRTSPDKRHVIWRVEGFAKEEAEALQKHLAQEWGADPAATDCARVLRLPGFYNHKYGVPYRVRTEGGRPESSCLYRPEDFPEIPLDRLSPAAQHRQIRRSTPTGPALTQSERDWAFAKRALARGETMASVIAAVADYRRDKPNPDYYATHTVRKAAAALTNEQKHPTYLIVDFER